MEEAIVVDVNAAVGEESRREQPAVAGEGGSTAPVTADNHGECPPEIKVSLFDESVENHFKAVDTISELCGEAEGELDQAEIARLSSSVTFLREWRHFNYQPRVVHFSCQSESQQGKVVLGGTTLPQFSAATVPKMEGQSGNTISPESRSYAAYLRVVDLDSILYLIRSCCSKDFVMYVGGSVWALDWCPRAHEISECDIKTEYIAVAAHPPESSYHKIGAPLSGRGVIQIWCLFNVCAKEEDAPLQGKKKPKRKSLIDERIKIKSTGPKKARGRPRKTPVNETTDNSKYVQALSDQLPEDSSTLLPADEGSRDTQEQSTEKEAGRKRSRTSQEVSEVQQEDPCNNDIAVAISTQPRKARGRPRKKPVNESVGTLDCSNPCVQALAVQFQGASETKQNPSNGEPVDNLVAQTQKRKGRAIEKRTNESIGNSDCSSHFVQALAQFPEGSLVPKENPSNNETAKVISQPQKRKGRPRKKLINESTDNFGVQALAVQLPEGSSEPKENLSNVSTQPQKRKGRPRKKPVNESVDDICVQDLVQIPEGSSEPKENLSNSETVEVTLTQPQKQKGRPRKKPINESIGYSDSNNHVQAFAIEFPESSSKLLPGDAIPANTSEQVAKRKTGKIREGSKLGVSENSLVTTSEPRRLKDKASVRANVPDNSPPLLAQNENDEYFVLNQENPSTSGRVSMGSWEKAANECSFKTYPARCSIPEDVALPRLMLCLGHNGKVAWDVKWRPCDVVCGTDSKHRMGYLAVLLGNGALEVWEVPSPRALRYIYSTCQKEGTDPRFVKLNPVFRCSMLKCGDRQSIPLTVEWSASSPHDLILAGCHDGVVAMWKFSANSSSKDTRPLLCFTADTVPIRALAWAPAESGPESANLIVTAGHKGLKFWDIRDPFRPLWDLNPVQRVIYSLDWLPDPRCVIVSFDDGTLRILSLLKAAYDVPVTGKPFVGTQQQGLHSYYCSSFAIWSVQVSRLTGMVAYCSADGAVLRFQLTTRAVEKDPLRNRAPHFLCGSLTEEESALTVTSPLPNIPFPMKKSLNEWGNAPRTIRGFLSVSNQEKRAREQLAEGQTSDEQPLVKQRDDPAIELGSEDTLIAKNMKQAQKTKTSGKKKPNANQALVCRDEERDNVHAVDGEKGEAVDDIEVFPPKIVAMHRVRWNMNKGSEKWLCYGGASGILRCQEINVSDAR
ncbi:hypothetical protein RJ640_030926 [Escallonia rubra]|uniref:Uncharacterized protein n=1 Tax=Escallonia rubra TaxID=112253 RepID=A0AA88QYK7_9ASTE|nr:hypothetical protein RJ640_030926 [Escallonia rubra]